MASMGNVAPSNDGSARRVSVEEMEVGSEPQPGSSTTSSRGPGKSPAHFTADLSPEQIKKMKLADTANGNSKSDEMLSEDECFEDLDEYEEEDDEQLSGNSEEYIDCAFASSRESKMSTSTTSEDDEDAQYEVLSAEEIVKCMRGSIQNTSAILTLPTTTTHMLLNYFLWDENKLIDAYYAGGDAGHEKLFKDAGISNPHTSAKGYNAPHVNGSQSEEQCQICFDQKKSTEMFGMTCGHRFCKACWRQYLTSQIVDEGQGDTIRCIAPNCNLLVDNEIVEGLISDAKVKSRYQQLITSSYVQSNRLLKWCPSPDCTNVIKINFLDLGGRAVTCKCRCTFCFQCSETAHAPICCEMLKKWLKKNSDDSETSTWISVNTKECPKCHANIQKNGGCNHMVCRNRACNQEFCWVCLGKWNNHDPYRCNRFDDENAKEARDEQERSRSSLNRYLFYFNRYSNHMNSLKLENNLYDAVAEKMHELQASMSWVEVQFLKLAVDTLCLCRQTLMYTYVFAFYSEKTGKNHQIEIFEGNQQDLQDAVEKLSGYLEREVDSTVSVTALKQKVQDMTKYCEGRRKVLLDHVDEGNDKDWWTFRNV